MLPLSARLVGGVEADTLSRNSVASMLSGPASAAARMMFDRAEESLDEVRVIAILDPSTAILGVNNVFGKLEKVECKVKFERASQNTTRLL